MSKVNLTMDQGADFSESFVVRDENGLPINLSGFTCVSQLKKHYSSATYYAFSTSVASNGTVTISMPAAVTSSISEGRWTYDVTLTSTANVVTRPISGIVTVSPGVTNEDGSTLAPSATGPTIYVVADLPTSLPAGSRSWVSDAVSPAWGAAVTGGGSTLSPVYFDGSTWVAG